MPDIRRGVDYSAGRPDPMVLRTLGYTFAVRYLCHHEPKASIKDPPTFHDAKRVTRPEIEALAAAGLDTVLVWQNRAGDVSHGYTMGVDHGRAARNQAMLLGAPSGAAIYASIDVDTRAGTGLLTACVEYLRGFRREIESGYNWQSGRYPAYELGVYGGLEIIRIMGDNGEAAYLWQTKAWSGTPTEWYPGAQLRQIAHNQKLPGPLGPDGRPGQLVDYNEAHNVDFGQWAPLR